MLAKITAPDLPQDCTEAELLIERHKEYKSEMDGRLSHFNQFYDNGHRFITEGHYLAYDIEDKIKILRQRMELLNNVWNQRNIIYQQNLDIQLFKREAYILENWLAIREGILKDDSLGENIPQVEELIRKHRDFEEAVKAQEDKFDALKRMTLIEEAFAKQKKVEAAARKAEKDRLEQERIEQRKRIEMARITELRRQESREHKYNNIPEDQINGDATNMDENPSTPPPVVKPGMQIRKTNSVAHMFERDRIRRGSDISVKRAESMKVGPSAKPVKRTPSFTTKRRGSFRYSKNAGNVVVYTSYKIHCN